MTDVLASRLETILPNGRGVWVPMDHSASSFPEQGLLDSDKAVDAVIEGGADAIVTVSYTHLTLPTICSV